jgi:hypothetical protein
MSLKWFSLSETHPIRGLFFSLYFFAHPVVLDSFFHFMRQVPGNYTAHTRPLNHFHQKKKKDQTSSVVLHTCNPSTQEAEVGGLRV